MLTETVYNGPKQKKIQMFIKTKNGWTNCDTLIKCNIKIKKECNTSTLTTWVNLINIIFMKGYNSKEYGLGRLGGSVV